MDYYYASRSFSTRPEASVLSRRGSGPSPGAKTHPRARSSTQSRNSADSDKQSEKASVKSKKRFRIPFPVTPRSSPTSSFDNRHTRVKSTTSSLESQFSVSMSVNKNARYKTVHNPPPLQLVASNYHPSQREMSPSVEIIAHGPPRSDSVRSIPQSSSSSLAQTQHSSPITPSFLPVSEEELRNRRLQKVERTLGEQVPPELVINSTPQSIASELPRQASVTSRIARRASTSLSALPASVSSSIGHARSKSREILGLGESPSLPIPRPPKRLPASVAPADEHFPLNTFAETTQRPSHREKRRPPVRPVNTSIPIPAVPTQSSVVSNVEKQTSDTTMSQSMDNPKAERALESPLDSSLSPPLSGVTHVNGMETWTSSRPPSILVSPLICAQRLSFQTIDDDAESYASEQPFAKLNNPSSHQPRPDTPFMIDDEPNSPKSLKRASLESHYPVVRHERRQGWSGEWNQQDMKEVISKLRNLK